MKAIKLRGASTDEELNKKSAIIKEELFNLDFNWPPASAGNPMRIRDVHKNIARCKTVLRQREIAQENNLVKESLRGG